uniref:Uncharacterized protein n=1 Tax=Candidatus Kentrum sp. FM TaxID=2126340 RepID=A0A450T1M4_9GAMM|nr:MAG: hypothetical protein BECKFM1743A_GA0114220_102246 [Candidatus Kentron sp. FM]VFJ60373.1 MAG: hypothetical protein BECKFM1743C_GA0114222_102717 [Candidatus Kentron sp. FM]VFK12802.1 MAG: hypothetical protein BECKFM1743B_GA0114221_102555 [Candidatus Kentron sp. FM]
MEKVLKDRAVWRIFVSSQRAPRAGTESETGTEEIAQQRSRQIMFTIEYAEGIVTDLKNILALRARVQTGCFLRGHRFVQNFSFSET